MGLVELNLRIEPVAVPAGVRRYLREAEARIDAFADRGRVTGFVPSDYLRAYQVLRSLAESTLTRGTRFCEWGSGFGVVAGLAALLEFDACGIEIETELVAEARSLAEEFDLAVEYVHGSFVPRGAEARVCRAGEYAWLTTDGDYAYDELGLDPADMDVIFAYPWPDEEAVTADLFDRYAGPGAVLVTYHSGDDFRIRRKVRKKGRA